MAWTALIVFASIVNRGVSADGSLVALHGGAFVHWPFGWIRFEATLGSAFAGIHRRTRTWWGTEIVALLGTSRGHASQSGDVDQHA
jgi:hypothetical protein